MEVFGKAVGADHEADAAVFCLGDGVLDVRAGGVEFAGEVEFVDLAVVNQDFAVGGFSDFRSSFPDCMSDEYYRRGRRTEEKRERERRPENHGVGTGNGRFSAAFSTQFRRVGETHKKVPLEFLAASGFLFLEYPAFFQRQIRALRSRIA